VVPRSFLGSALLSFCSSPIHFLLRLLGSPKLYSLYAGENTHVNCPCKNTYTHIFSVTRIFAHSYTLLVRLVLALWTCAALSFFRRCFAERFHDRALNPAMAMVRKRERFQTTGRVRGISSLLPQFSAIYIFVSSLLQITCAQFHLLFYSSRPLPNTFALIISTVAYGFWLRDNISSSISLLALSSIVFRCDTVVLAFPLLLVSVLQRKITIRSLLITGTISSLISIGIYHSVLSSLCLML